MVGRSASAQTPLRVNTAKAGLVLSDTQVREVLTAALEGQFNGAKVLVLIPDHTRSAPLPLMFRLLTEILYNARQLDFMVALGTHPPLDEAALCRLVGITHADRQEKFAHIGLLNHAWDDPKALSQLGVLERAQIQAIAGNRWHESLGGDVPIRINRAALEYDHILIISPVFPHEVVGFSGGAKYLFPGIGAAELINVTHWLGALITVRETIGIKHTPVRKMIHEAAKLLPTPITCLAMVVEHDEASGVFIGDYQNAWEAAADFSAQRHIIWLDKPVQRVLSVTPPMYDELWTGAKAMYKLDPAIADGGEVVVYAPHLSVVSHVHGGYISEIGYHVRDYFLKQWDRFKHVPLGVIAHSTHLKGTGQYTNGIETPRITVTMAAQFSESTCHALNLAYADVNRISPSDWIGREAEGVLYVPKAGEMLYKIKESQS